MAFDHLARVFCNLRICSVLVEAGTETGWPAAPILGDPTPPDCWIESSALSDILARSEATVVDLSLGAYPHQRTYTLRVRPPTVV